MDTLQCSSKATVNTTRTRTLHLDQENTEGSRTWSRAYSCSKTSSSQRVTSFHALPLSSRGLHHGVLSCRNCMSFLRWSWFVFPFLYYLALPCRVMSCLVFSCLVLLCRALPCLASPRRALPCFVLHCLDVCRFIWSGLLMTCQVKSCHVMSGIVLSPSMSAQTELRPRGCVRALPQECRCQKSA